MDRSSAARRRRRVQRGGDCDDARADVNPDALEICDGIDNDCDPATAEAGTATFTNADGVADVTAALEGTAEAPAVFVLDAPGTLAICEGTYFARLEVANDVDIIGPPGSAATALDGGGAGTVIDITGDQPRRTHDSERRRTDRRDSREAGRDAKRRDLVLVENVSTGPP